MKRQCLEECYAKITEAAAAVKLEGRELAEEHRMCRRDVGGAEPYFLDLGQDILVLNLGLHCEVEDPPLMGTDLKVRITAGAL